MYIHMNIHMYSLPLSLRRLGSNSILIAVNIPDAQILVSKYCFL